MYAKVERTQGGRPSKDEARRLPAFLVFSAGLHIALLLAWQPVTPDLVGRPHVTHFIDIVLVESGRPRSAAIPAYEPPAARAVPPPRAGDGKQVAPRRSPTPIAPPRAPMSVARVPAARIKPAAEPAVVAPRADLRPALDHSTGAAPEPLRAYVEGLLLTDLARHFEYPLLARRRGWQGIVLLSLTVEADGALERVRINRSSGYEVLDRSALDTMRRIRRLANLERRLNGRVLELRLPIIYRLTD